MASYLLDKIVCDSGENFWAKIAPLIIFGMIWLFGVIAKAAQSKTGKKEEQQPHPRPKPLNEQQPADLGPFVRMVKQRYADAKAEATRSTEQRSYKPGDMLPQKPRSAGQPSRATQPSSKPRVQTGIYNTPRTGFNPRMPAGPGIPKITEMPATLEPALPVFPEQPKMVDEHPAEMTALDHRIYEPTHHSFLPELTQQLATPDGLRKAVLYSEILGKPIGLRDN